DARTPAAGADSWSHRVEWATAAAGGPSSDYDGMSGIGIGGRVGAGGVGSGGIADTGAAGFRTSSGGAYPTGSTGPGPLLVAAYTKGLSSYVFEDFDRDGIVDLAVTATHEAQGPSELIIHRGLGNEAYASGVSYPTGTQTYDVAAADVNQDGVVDLIVANAGAGQIGTVGVHLGVGDATFLPGVTYPTGTYFGSVSVANLNDDQWPDIIAATGATNPVIGVMFGRGNGTFGTTMDYTYTPPAGRVSSVTAGDLDGDALPDLLVATTQSNPNVVFESIGTVTVLHNLGNGTFTPSHSQSVDRNQLSMVLTDDMNGDQRRDLAFLSWGHLGLSFGSDNGAFSSVIDYPMSSYSSAFAIGDLNGDSAADLVILDYIANQASVCLNLGDGTFGASTDYPAGYYPGAVSIGDYTGDGKPDVAVARLATAFSSETGWVGILPGLGDGTLRVGNTTP
ncbi:MAG TPA: VCBS repeat-containing protein, partial [Polyangiaceae bacterium]